MFFLFLCQFGDSFFRKLQHSAKLVIIKRGFFTGALDFDELAAASHDHVHIDIGSRIQNVVQVQLDFVIQQADADRRDGVSQRAITNFAAGTNL